MKIFNFNVSHTISASFQALKVSYIHYVYCTTSGQIQKIDIGLEVLKQETTSVKIHRGEKQAMRGDFVLQDVGVAETSSQGEKKLAGERHRLFCIISNLPVNGNLHSVRFDMRTIHECGLDDSVIIWHATFAISIRSSPLGFGLGAKVIESVCVWVLSRREGGGEVRGAATGNVRRARGVGAHG